MKTLIIVRHAKSSWEHYATDHERELNQTGVSDALLVASKLNLNFNSATIDAILCSDAKRTTDTAALFISKLNIKHKPISYLYDLYDFEGRNFTQVIKQCDNTLNTIMVFGHNHAITAFVNTYGNKSIDNVPTSGVVIIEFDTMYWDEISVGKTLLFLCPKDFKS